jgi:DNA relaxase NicK
MKTSIDWFSFRTKSPEFKIIESLRPMFGTTGDLLALQSGLKGRDGWETRSNLVLADIVIGTIDSGGHSQRDWLRVIIPGSGCEWVQDWGQAVPMSEKLTEADLRRLDIALTTYQGEVGIETILRAHEDGLFRAPRGGRNPNLRSIINSDRFMGNTVYIGDRKADKFLLCYEKGKEAMKDLPPQQRALQTHYEGFPIDDVFRVELECKASENFLPFQIVDHRDAYFAGAYPFLAKLLPGLPERRLSKLPDFKPRAALTAGLENCRHSYGQILRLALQFFDGDRDRLLDAILADKPSSKLIEAGVLTI